MSRVISVRFFIGIVLSFLIASPVLAEIAAAVVFFSGNPQLTAAGGVVRPLKKGDSIASGETVDAADGRVQLRFTDGASMSLQPGTQLKVDSYRFSGNGGQAVAGDGVVLSLIKGALRTVTGWLGKQDRTQYRIGTSVATIGIRGTEFAAALDGTGLTVSTYVGLVEVCSKVGCAEVGPSETVWVRSSESRPQLRTGQEGIGLKTDTMLPATPVNREAMPSQQVIQPMQQPIQPIPNTSPTYTSPSANSPTRAP